MRRLGSLTEFLATTQVRFLLDLLQFTNVIPSTRGVIHIHSKYASDGDVGGANAPISLKSYAPLRFRCIKGIATKGTG